MTSELSQTDSPRPRASAPTGVQQRGVKRVEAMLDAAEALLGEQGYAAATLKAIADRAGIPTTSVYHYFADRHQLEVELLQRHLRELDARSTAALGTGEAAALRDTVDVVIDTHVGYCREYPSFVELWFAGRANPA